MWKGRVAFQRRYDHRRDFPYLYVARLDGAGRSQRVPGGQRNECRRINGRPTCTDPRGSRAEGLELSGRWLAFTWKYRAFGEAPAADLRLARLDRGSSRVVDRAGRGGLTQVEPEFPSFSGGRLVWIRTCMGDPSGCVGRVGLRRASPAGGTVEQFSRPRDVKAFDSDASASYALTGRCLFPPPDGAACELRRLDFRG